MRKQQSSEIKLLHRRFPFLHKSDIEVIYDFCEESVSKTEKVLTIAKDTRSPGSIAKTLLARPEKAQVMLASFERRYDEQYAKPAVQTEAKTFEFTAFRFFRYIPRDLLLQICGYLDPYSMASLGASGPLVARVYLSEYFGVYYRTLCVNLFEKVKHRLPDPCRFEQVREYIHKQGKQFGPNTRNAIRNNLRKYVWGRDIEVQKPDLSYLTTFKGYKDLYFRYPRLHFNGIYSCKHQYRKQQQKDLLRNTSQAHYVTHYRYFRFLDDGTVISLFLTNKTTPTVIAQMMSTSVLDRQVKMQGNIMIGQYIQDRGAVEVKLYKQGTLFTYEMEIGDSGNGCIADILQVKSYYLRVVDEKEIVQCLQDENSKNKMCFRYGFSEPVRRQNTSFIRSSGL